MITLDKNELAFFERFIELKNEAGTHSPSIHKLLSEFPGIRMEVDACFLCNPYAFNLFYEKLKDTDLEKYIKFYPPQNEEISELISKFINIPSDHILIGNGAIEIIEQIIGNYFKDKRLSIILPTFSTYYELGNERLIDYFYLKSEDNFILNVDDYISWIKKNKSEVILLVNPNNPTGTVISKKNILKIYNSLEDWQTLIVDESFIHFINSDESIEQYAIGKDNIIIIKSLSKDFGIAGVRLGYSINKKFRNWALRNSFLWNSNGIAYFFTTLLANCKFKNEYKKCKIKYNKERDFLFKELNKIPKIKVYESSANFFIIETLDFDISVLFTKLFYIYGIYSRILNDKKGLLGNYLRIASKDKSENIKIINAINNIIKNEK